MPFLDLPEAPNQLKSLNIISSSYNEYKEYDPREKNDHLVLEKIAHGNVKKQMFGISELSISNKKPQKNLKEVYISPLPGFVVKTIQTSDQKKRFPQGTKVFLNLCHSEDVIPPKDGIGRDIIPKIMRGWHWEIPIVISMERWDVDKAGKKCLVIDCCCNTSVMNLSKEDINVRLVFIETCLELVEDKTGMVLSREYTIPKMKAKGELQSSILELDNTFNEKIQEVNTESAFPKYSKKTLSLKSKKDSTITDKDEHSLHSLKTDIENKTIKLTKPTYTIEKLFRSNNIKNFQVTIDLLLIEDITRVCLELINKNGVFSLMLSAKDIYSELEIPIFEFYKEEKLPIDAFFVRKKRKLYIFIPYV
ncbi:hypothetical protein PORY_000542 [Pneumocystis oryctolagi]|uniref:Uncharacterized protein n=1 Tax=Pneumocystis oryctolagi TaxID=42067 RepID=A0ACB7CHA0_9ASCO|nr:hypothetical protein PORY_000542 [Pneumocystis oryctolagi]